MNLRHSALLNRLPFGKNLSFISLIVFSPSLKHDRSFWPKNIISIIIIIFYAFYYRAMKPCFMSSRYSTNVFDRGPPRTWTSSAVSLKGAFSNLTPLPGALERKNPKSICIMCPSMSINILPLCLSLICKI